MQASDRDNTSSVPLAVPWHATVPAILPESGGKPASGITGSPGYLPLTIFEPPHFPGESVNPIYRRWALHYFAVAITSAAQYTTLHPLPYLWLYFSYNVSSLQYFRSVAYS
ncbi:hypothetical protein NGB58_25650 [Escherichia coli]|nr:hypothetical protein [Escherichia coli]